MLSSVECRVSGVNVQVKHNMTQLYLMVTLTHGCRYIRLYGMKFSKEDHLMLINLLLEMMTIPDLDFSLVQKFAQLLTTLLK